MPSSPTNNAGFTRRECVPSSRPQNGHHALVEWSFRERADGQVDAVVEGVPDVLNEALADAVSSRPPRGEHGPGPSTYWIDVARERATTAAAAGDEKRFTWGNAY